MNDVDPQTLHALAAAARAPQLHADLDVLHRLFETSRAEALRSVDEMLDEMGVLSQEERRPLLERLDAQIRVRDALTEARIRVDLGLEMASEGRLPDA